LQRLAGYHRPGMHHLPQGPFRLRKQWKDWTQSGHDKKRGKPGILWCDACYLEKFSSQWGILKDYQQDCVQRQKRGAIQHRKQEEAGKWREAFWRRERHEFIFRTLVSCFFLCPLIELPESEQKDDGH